ncbi:hypothetical protein D8Y22_19665 [Salinadaptatus halalkaliphilus]|uniref:DUF7973 domain-containing protein n=1 Tax=Salinadaptatus halalkaliphilus TaxID=2419781 RepID=A0A4S3TJX5_9EURY|nr:hypothetical protein [Salinadaptatus halalkaliphilus]THE63205.1 hypothetical protein D8Y22_19665 [Salinadaptatus halalkaliphilus]
MVAAFTSWELLLVAFSGGALQSFSLAGLVVTVGELYALVFRTTGGTAPPVDLTDTIAFGAVLGPHVAFGCGAVAAAFAAQRGYLETGFEYHDAKRVSSSRHSPIASCSATICSAHRRERSWTYLNTSTTSVEIRRVGSPRTAVGWVGAGSPSASAHPVVEQATVSSELAAGFASTETFRRTVSLVGPVFTAVLIAGHSGFSIGLRTPSRSRSLSVRGHDRPAVPLRRRSGSYRGFVRWRRTDQTDLCEIVRTAVVIPIAAIEDVLWV